MPQHIFFDFFGTLVSYSPSRREQGYEISHQILKEAGAAQEYEEFLDLWCQVSDEFEEKSADTHREFSMVELGTEFLQRALGRYPSEELAKRFADCYVAEWNKGVRYLPGLREFLGRLSERYTLGVITNTSDAELVHMHLRQLGVHDSFRAIVTSLEYGLRKPHPAIFRHAMQLLGADSADSIHVGDSFDADYGGGSSVGMHCFLIDPSRSSGVPDKARLEDLFDLERKLAVME